MAETPVPKLVFGVGCPDCGERTVTLPGALPIPGDDFDWLVRDYDGFRTFMMEELAARFQERRRWAPADMEVVLVETLSVVLDQISDLLDRVASEAYLGTARRPQSVRRLLCMIGYDALLQAKDEARAAGVAVDDPAVFHERWLEEQWLRFPHLMERARLEGPRSIRQQKRMVTTEDYRVRMEEHPLVLRASAWCQWMGSWEIVNVAVQTLGETTLDRRFSSVPPTSGSVVDLRKAIDAFHDERGLRLPDWAADPTLRSVLQVYLDAYRMAGKEVLLLDGEPVGIHISIAVRVHPEFFQSEVRRAILDALGSGVGGYFEAGCRVFGEDLHAGDLYENLMALDGVEAVCLNRFKRVGKQFPNMADAGTIRLDGIEFAVCDRNPARPERGYLNLQLQGGRKG